MNSKFLKSRNFLPIKANPLSRFVSQISMYRGIQRLEKATRLWFTLPSFIQDDVTATRFLLKWAPNVWATLEFSVKAKVMARVPRPWYFPRRCCTARKIRGKRRFEIDVPDFFYSRFVDYWNNENKIDDARNMTTLGVEQIRSQMDSIRKDKYTTACSYLSSKVALHRVRTIH